MVRKHLMAVHAPELKPQMRTPLRPANFRGFWPFSQDFFDFLTPCGSYLRVWGKRGVWTRLYIKLECILGQIWKLGPWSLSSSSSQNKPLDHFCKKWEKIQLSVYFEWVWENFLFFQVPTDLHYIGPHGHRSTSFFMLNTKKISRVDELIFRVIVPKIPPEQHEIESGPGIRWVLDFGLDFPSSKKRAILSESDKQT